VLNEEGELVWLTPHPRDSQPEGEREREMTLSHVLRLRAIVDA